MLNKNYTSILIMAGLVVVLAILERNFYLVNISIHSLVDLFAGGRSLVKVELFLGYVFLLCLLGFIHLRIKYIPKFRVTAQWLLASILASFTYNLILLFLFFEKYGFSAKSLVVTFHNNEISSTHFLHNHLMKGFNGLLLQWFGSGQQENIDTGLAFVGLLPSIWYIVGAILVLISAILLLIKFIEIYDKRTSGHAILILLYGIISFSLLKNMLDGGMFNRETPIALTALLFVLDRFEKKKIPLIWKFMPLVGYGIVMVWSWPVNNDPIDYFFSTLLPMLTLGGILLVLLKWQSNKALGLKTKLLLGTAAIALICLPLSKSVATYRNSLRTIDNQGAIVGLYHLPMTFNTSQIQWEELEKINDLIIYRLTASVPVTLQEILSDNRLLGNLQPITLPGKNCLLDSNRYKINFDLYTPDVLANNSPHYQYGKITTFQPIRAQTALHSYRVTAEFNECAPRTLNIIQELLKMRGQTTFFLTNITPRYGTNN